MKLLQKIQLNGLSSYSALQFDNGETLPLLMDSKADETGQRKTPVKTSKFNEYFVAIIGELDNI